MTAWQEVCKERLAVARSWDQSEPLNRRGVRYWRRRLWWAKYGIYIWGTTGGILGGLVGVVLARLIIGAIA